MFIPVPLLVLMLAIIVTLALLLWRGKREGRDLTAPPRTQAINSHRMGRSTFAAVDVIELPLAVWEQAKALMMQDRKLEAIKLIREETGCSLKQAKDTAEQLYAASASRSS